jgi:PHD/YefM family antitoxin component YafN of YafNO toxin-antitoxin module
MNTLPAQEIKRRGIAAIDEIIENGDVHIIRNNTPEYVVLSAERYQSLLADENEAYITRLKASLEDLSNGRLSKFDTATALLKALDEDDG